MGISRAAGVKDSFAGKTRQKYTSLRRDEAVARRLHAVLGSPNGLYSSGKGNGRSRTGDD